MADDAAPVLSHRDGAVQTLTLNRPQALNSFNGAMHDALSAALKAAAADAAVRCVVITGAGRGFCAGQDLSRPGRRARPHARRAAARHRQPDRSTLQAAGDAAAPTSRCR